MPLLHPLSHTRCDKDVSFHPADGASISSRSEVKSELDTSIPGTSSQDIQFPHQIIAAKAQSKLGPENTIILWSP